MLVSCFSQSLYALNKYHIHTNFHESHFEIFANEPRTTKFSTPKKLNVH